MKVNPFGSEKFIERGGRIPAPIHSLKTDVNIINLLHIYNKSLAKVNKLLCLIFLWQ